MGHASSSEHYRLQLIIIWATIPSIVAHDHYLISWCVIIEIYSV